MFLYEKEKGSAAAKGELTLKIAKHRNGATGEITLGWVRDYTKFRTIAKASEFPYEG
jgi:replicative DNA helicase